MTNGIVLSSFFEKDVDDNFSKVFDGHQCPHPGVVLKKSVLVRETLEASNIKKQKIPLPQFFNIMNQIHNQSLVESLQILINIL